MSVYALWWGGPSYSLPSLQDLEVFASVNDAENEFRLRASHHPYYPVVDQDTTIMDVFLSDPRESSDPCPDYRLEFKNERLVWCCG